MSQIFSMGFKPKSPMLPPDVARFAAEAMANEDHIESRLRTETSRLPNGHMISPADVGQFLAFLTESLNAKQVLEIGTFTGYTALKMARALPPDGKLLTLDVNVEWTAIARRYWTEAGLDEKIDLLLVPAAETLAALLLDGRSGTFDLVFIDANKKAYREYYEAALKLLRPVGLVVLDNMLWDGEVAAEIPPDAIGRFLKQLNLEIAEDPRVRASLLTVGDGLLLARKY